ncbi:hypothetical protein [Patiriisocius hiemis]|uniref:NADH dehydrogenase n=1 Tax=Patiriisocius hiemis TaxID=3075604 RepID=A0ABU2YDI9_9FLAO|nr:hypothetical protein [Constantimarinum sp. W242]MDT0556062.1 hypothetical protein [Constantimarinum sp. W242]
MGLGHKKIVSLLSGLKTFLRSRLKQSIFNEDTRLLAIGTMLSKQQFQMVSSNINDYEFKIFSQWGDDGIIQYLIKNLSIENTTFIEFGVEDYLESNTRFLMMHDNWSGFIIDGSNKFIKNLKKYKWYWKYDLRGKCAFITKDNINSILLSSGFKSLGILSVDIDGNDYHVLEEIDLGVLNPSIIIVEYNAVFGKDRYITVPYKEDFVRNNMHYSNLYFGASLPAFTHVANNKGYALVGCTIAGNNAYFVRRDLLNKNVSELSIEEAFKDSKFRESRNKDYSLSYLRGDTRLAEIKGMPVINLLTGEEEEI